MAHIASYRASTPSDGSDLQRVEASPHRPRTRSRTSALHSARLRFPQAAVFAENKKTQCASRSPTLARLAPAASAATTPSRCPSPRSHGRGMPRVPLTDRRPVTAALRYRYTGPVWPVTGGNRLNSNPNSNKFKNSYATGSDRFTGRFDRFTGRFDWYPVWLLHYSICQPPPTALRLPEVVA